jgi:hypothetical protein
MFARGRRAPLICSALLGALVISCGGPSPQEEPAQEANSVPVARAAPSRGVLIIVTPGDWEDWLAKQNRECEIAGYPAGCLPITYGGDDPADPKNTNCEVRSVELPSSYEVRDRDENGNSKAYVQPGARLTVTITASKHASGTSNGTENGGTRDNVNSKGNGNGNGSGKASGKASGNGYDSGKASGNGYDSGKASGNGHGNGDGNG